MITHHPRQAVGAVLGVMALSLFVSVMIGQFGGGPWGGLPSWLGTATWVAFNIAGITLLVLAAYLAAAHLRTRRTAR